MKHPKIHWLLVIWVCLTIDIQLFGQLSINEWLTSNSTGLQDESGEYADWIEIYNSGDSPIDLLGYYLSDDPTEPLKFQINGSLIIESESYLLL